MRRTFGVDVLECPQCGGRLRLVALIERASTVERVLRHLGLPTDLPEPRSARAPPLLVDDPADTLADVVKALPVGSDVEVVVLEVDPSRRRIRLSRKAVLDAREADEVREYNERADVKPPEGFGSLADKLRGALKSREK
jgi:hypothetical protein